MLASIQKIIDIQPIEGADKISVATVLGWQVVVRKDQFKINDLVVYIQIDTVCPELPFFEFLRNKNFRVKSIKLRGQVSQGLIIGIDELPMLNGKKLKEDNDVTELIGVTKFNKTIEVPDEKERIPKKWHLKLWYMFRYRYLYKWFPKLKPKTNTSFPSDIVSKTDEERIQNKPFILEKYKGCVFNVSEKLNGSSITLICETERFLFKNKNKYRVCSRNYEIYKKTNEWYKVFIDTNFKVYLNELMEYFTAKRIVVQGEYIGKPQGNPYKLSSNEIRLFNIYVDGKLLTPDQFSVACALYDIPRCPNLGNIILDTNMQDLIKFAEGKSVLNNQVEREGVVLRDLDGKISYKVISNKYLLKNDE